jgi:two-component system invasion response regulator UvrY
MAYVVMGMGTKEIAQRMLLDITTVSTYRRGAFEKPEVENVIELKEKFHLYKT